ncbi:MAG TPA: hypothetical protein VGQ83_15575, partial [Polyangia bacterium]
MPRPLQGLIDLARRDTGAALARARRDGHAGDRCHYLAWVAHYADDRRAGAIAHEALAACEELENPYGSVALAAWPLRALAERGLDGECERALPRVFERVQRLANPVNRLDALERVFQGVFPAPRARRRVLVELIAACRQASSWKAPRCLAWTAATLVAAPADCALVLAALPDGRH